MKQSPIDDVLLSQHVVKETRESFSKQVEEIVWDKDISYLDAVYHLMDLKGLEPEIMGKLLSKDLYAKIEREAEDLSLIKVENKTARIM